MRKYFPLLLIFLLIVPSSRAQNNPTIAVFDLDLGPGLDPGLKSPLSRELNKALAGTNKYRVIDRGYVNNMLQKQISSSPKGSSEGNIFWVGKSLAATEIVTGRVENIGGSCHLSILFTNVETGEIEKMETRLCSCEKGSLEYCIDSATEILSGTAIPSAPPSFMVKNNPQAPAPKNLNSSSGAPVIRGRLIFAGKPVSTFTQEKPSFIIFDRETQKPGNFNVTYNPQTSEFALDELPPGKVPLQINVDIDANKQNGKGYSGDFYGDVNGISPSPPSLNFPIELKQVLHLTHPINNDLPDMNQFRTCENSSDNFLKNPVILSWEPFKTDLQNIKYEYFVDRMACPFNRQDRILERSLTEENKITLNLPPSKTGEYYILYLYALMGENRRIGSVATNGALHDFRFRIGE